MTGQNSEERAVAAMMAHLFEPATDRYGHAEKRSVLEEIARRRISAMAAELADEMIRSQPNLREIMRSRIAALIERVIADDPYVDASLTEAVAAGLRKLAKLPPLDELDQD
jgi:hypothetical protein